MKAFSEELVFELRPEGVSLKEDLREQCSRQWKQLIANAFGGNEPAV